MAMTDSESKTSVQMTPGPDARESHPYGSREHALAVTAGRHPGVVDGLQWLTYGHLPVPLQHYSAPFYRAAVMIIDRVATDSPELTTAINRLIEAKDSAVRAGIRNETGRAGSIPRPQEVVDPPSLTGEAPATQTLVAKDGIAPAEKFGIPGEVPDGR